MSLPAPSIVLQALSVKVATITAASMAIDLISLSENNDRVHYAFLNRYRYHDYASAVVSRPA